MKMTRMSINTSDDHMEDDNNGDYNNENKCVGDKIKREKKEIDTSNGLKKMRMSFIGFHIS